jgi:Raf kinase inhibitor-like YbhB/YbcL family protein
LPEGIPRQARLKEPPGALQGENSWTDGETIGYRGPLPPRGHGVHHYHFKLYALDVAMEMEPGLPKNTVLRKIGDHTVAEGELVGTYQR